MSLVPRHHIATTNTHTHTQFTCSFPRLPRLSHVYSLIILLILPSCFSTAVVSPCTPPRPASPHARRPSIHSIDSARGISPYTHTQCPCQNNTKRITTKYSYYVYTFPQICPVRLVRAKVLPSAVAAQLAGPLFPCL